MELIKSYIVRNREDERDCPTCKYPLMVDDCVFYVDSLPGIYCRPHCVLAALEEKP